MFLMFSLKRKLLYNKLKGGNLMKLNKILYAILIALVLFVTISNFASVFAAPTGITDPCLPDYQAASTIHPRSLVHNPERSPADPQPEGQSLAHPSIAAN